MVWFAYQWESIFPLTVCLIQLLYIVWKHSGLYFFKGIFNLNFVGAESHIFNLKASKCQTYAKQLDQIFQFVWGSHLSAWVYRFGPFVSSDHWKPSCSCIISEVQYLTKKGDHSEELVAN